MAVLSFVLLLVPLSVVLSGFCRLRGTTLVTAACWAGLGLLAACGAALLERNMGHNRPALSDFAWYASAVVLLCPGIAVLGARRPGAAAWSWFVLLPLVLVLLWPAVASTSLQNSSSPLELETPAIVAFGVVLVMAGGNYFGTRYTGPVLLYVLAVGLLAGCRSPVTSEFLPPSAWCHLISSALLSLAAGWAWLRTRALAETDGDSKEGNLDRLWQDFVDAFGIVWARRVLERVNQSAAHEKWCGRLHLDGFEWDAGVSADGRERTVRRLEHTLRWLLKRFADAPWIDRRIGDERTGSLSAETGKPDETAVGESSPAGHQ